MDARLMTDGDMRDITGKKRHSAQVAWFRQHFGLTPVTSGDGRIILTWAAFEALQARRAGIVQADTIRADRPPLIPVRRPT
jgi:hypothetical protein